MHRISILCPSRLQPNLASTIDGNLYLERALMSTRRRQVFEGAEFELIVGLDVDSPPLPARFDDVLTARSTGKGQAQAVNAASKLATGDVIAMIEEDDSWHPMKLAIQVPLLETYDFVSCNQRELDEQNNFLRVNDFATPSGWLMKREVWDSVGGFDETFKYHVDTEWLGRLNRSGFKRAHLVPDGHPTSAWLEQVAKHSAVLATKDVTEPLVNRLVNELGGMSAIKTDHARLGLAFSQLPDSDPALAGIKDGDDAGRAFAVWCASQPDSPHVASMREHGEMMARFGQVPW